MATFAMAEHEIRWLATTQPAARFVSQSVKKTAQLLRQATLRNSRRLFDGRFFKGGRCWFQNRREGSAVLAFELTLRVHVTLFATVGRREQVAGKQNRPGFFEDHYNFTAKTHDDRKALKRFDRIVCGGWHVMLPLVLSVAVSNR